MSFFHSKTDIGINLLGGKHNVRMIKAGRPLKDSAGDDVEYFTLRVEADTDTFARLELIPHDDSGSETGEMEPVFTLLLEDGNVERLVAALVAVRELRASKSD